MQLAMYCKYRLFFFFPQCIGISVVIIAILLFWLPFTGNFRVQSPLACLQAGGKYEELEQELKDLRVELKNKVEDYTTLRDKHHDMQVKMVRQEVNYSNLEKELAAKKEELQGCKDLKDNYFLLQLNGTENYYKLLLDDKDAYNALQLSEEKRKGNLTIQIKICEERLKACNDQFNVMTDVIPVKEGSEQGTDQCPENDYACYYTRKAGHILQWMLHLGEDTKHDSPQ